MDESSQWATFLKTFINVRFLKMLPIWYMCNNIPYICFVIIFPSLWLACSFLLIVCVILFLFLLLLQKIEGIEIRGNAWYTSYRFLYSFKTKFLSYKSQIHFINSKFRLHIGVILIYSIRRFFVLFLCLIWASQGPFLDSSFSMGLISLFIDDVSNLSVTLVLSVISVTSQPGSNLNPAVRHVLDDMGAGKGVQDMDSAHYNLTTYLGKTGPRCLQHTIDYPSA